MKILHLYSNWKWTGPAEHALNLARSFQRAGHDVTFCCSPPPEGVPDSIVDAARRSGIEPLAEFRLNKHFNLSDNMKDIRPLWSFLRREKFDIIHCHLPNDHALAGAALRLNPARSALVRSCYEGSGMPGGLRFLMSLMLLTDGLITISERTRSQVVRRRCIGAHKVWKVDVPVDLERFNRASVQGGRAVYCLSEDAVVGGIVARVQTHRRFEVLLEALQYVIREFPGFRFMIIGRGTHIEDIAIRPSQKMGIRSNLIFTGYKKEDFISTLSCLDFKVFLVPGSDGSCRAVREAMAMGIPVIAADRGMLAEIVDHGKSGLVIDDTPEKLAEAIMYMVEHPEKRREMGAGAREKARSLFSPAVQAERVEQIYEHVMKKKQKKAGK